MRVVQRLAVGLLTLAACGVGPEGVEPAASPGLTTSTVSSSSNATTSTTVSTGACADVIAAEIVASGDGTYRVSATVSSADTGEEKYADEWRVVGPDGAVLGIRVLAHPHVNEQPFTRSLSGVEIGGSVETVRVEARDSVEGYCGTWVAVEVP